ncbi:branched-chain amino acid aminotransferase [Bacillus manliponensis]|uniref:Branched-chain-amino-acid aminotransferase n=1 Tax=Bacillus manliponensis TaxID=574376 RepID=A0A073JS95_9BACI|nr:branched-chain amino acid aminotransferase [Bacillus manliponensis]KEK17132.1 branched-chain amino acid aminotransferase [Bacillus manliponensis]
MNQTIEFIRSTTRKDKPGVSSLGFGNYFTDHMFVMDYDETNGWHSPRITPYEPLVLDPGAAVFHYGQAVFEGLKAYETSDERILLFRPKSNIERFNISNERIGIPPLDEELMLEALKQLIEIEKDWIPEGEGTSLYIRPFVIATEPCLGVRPSKQYKFMIILSPVGSYYGEQLKAVKIYVESEYVRAVKGGVGFAKTAGNYAASLQPQIKAEKLGYDQVLWLDAVEKKYVEEVGSMNIFFKINGEIVTPKLNGSILGGVTRDSVVELLQHWGVPVREEKISIAEVYEAYQKGELEEVFGTGTAAVIAPVGELSWNGEKITINNFEIGELSQKIYDAMTAIQNGKETDPFGWTVEV